MNLTTAHATSTAAPAAFFARWKDMGSWPEWSPDTEWVRLDGPFEVGSAGVMKPAKGPKVKFRIVVADTDREYTDVTSLAGARLTFQHVVVPTERGSTLDVRITMEGPMTWLWSRLLGPNFERTAQADLDRLVGLVEAEAPTSRHQADSPSQC